MIGLQKSTSKTVSVLNRLRHLIWNSAYSFLRVTAHEGEELAYQYDVGRQPLLFLILHQVLQDRAGTRLMLWPPPETDKVSSVSVIYKPTLNP